MRTGVALPGSGAVYMAAQHSNTHDLGPAPKWALWRLQDDDAQGNMDRGQVRPELARAAKGPR